MSESNSELFDSMSSEVETQGSITNDDESSQGNDVESDESSESSLDGMN